ncbi:MAG: hypothetical protein KAV82_08995 [Phycisphaerae bacterium]|nr:hypothetical protein [Phycisphaerae bacterium]
MKSTLNRTNLFLVLPALSAFILLGCVKRKETIKVAPDGGVSIRLEYEADSAGELDEGDSTPSTTDRWSVTRQVKIDDKSKENHVLTAEKAFPAGTVLPDCYAAASHPEAELSLRFPTRLRIEQRPDGQYYHFYRVYPVRRAWAYLETIREELFKPLTERSDGKPFDEWSYQSRVEMIRTLAGFEILKMTVFARSAFLEVSPQMPQDGWLKVRAALRGLEDEPDYDRIVSLLGTEEDEERNRAFEKEAQAFEAKGMDRMISALITTCGYTGQQAAEFKDCYLRHKRYHEISEDLNDDSFEITVEMPGEIVAANGVKIEGNRVVWEFDAKELRYQDLELMATSRVVR